MIKVFVASPYTKGDTAVNVKAQIDAGNELIKLGFAPFLPLLSHFQHMIHPQDYDTWCKLDIEWLKQCDCLFRLPGESAGADNEVEVMENVLFKPVFYNTTDLINHYMEKYEDEI